MRALISIKERLPLIFILAAGSVIRIAGLSFRSFFSDEIFMVRTVQSPLATLFAIDAPHGPLPFYILHFWSRSFGLSEFWMRMPSAIFGLLTCYFIYKLAFELSDKRTALTAAAIAALSPFLILYDQTARWYSLFAMTATASTYCLLRYLKFRSLRSLAAYMFFALAMMYTETIALLVLFFHLTAALLLFKKRDPRIFAGFLALLLLYIPWLRVFSLSFHRVAPGSFVERGVSGGILFRFFYALYSFSVGQTISPFNLPFSAAACFFVLALAGAGYISIWRSNRPAAVFLMLFMAISMAQTLTQVNLPHYMIHASAALIILIAAGITSIKKKPVFVSAAAILICIYVYSLYNLFSGQQYNRMEFTDDWRGIAAYVTNISGKNDLIIHSSDPFEHYCPDRTNLIRYGDDIKVTKRTVEEYLKKHQDGGIIMVYSPLSGLFASDTQAGKELKAWLGGKLHRHEEKDFNRDPDFERKRALVKRSFPEFRISVTSYSPAKTFKQ